MIIDLTQIRKRNDILMNNSKTRRNSNICIRENEAKKIKGFHGQSEVVNSIIVGDCSEIMQKIDKNTFDMVFVDPPYNMQLQNELYRPNNTKVDAVDDEWEKFNGSGHYDEFSRAWPKETKRVL